MKNKLAQLIKRVAQLEEEMIKDLNSIIKFVFFQMFSNVCPLNVKSPLVPTRTRSL